LKPQSRHAQKQLSRSHLYGTPAEMDGNQDNRQSTQATDNRRRGRR
jgi:hypothetical protein